MAPTMAVEVGAEFDTYELLTEAIRTYEAENFVNLIIRDTRKVEAAAKRNQRKNYNPAIKYSDISYCCTYGGKKYVSHSTGKRNHKTIKQACPFSLKVRATVDGQRLFVREMCASHNHELSEAEFRLHPKQRKLDIGSQEEIANLLSMEPDKKLLRDKLMQVTGKVILMKDIHNIKTRLVNPKIKPKDPQKEELMEKDCLVEDGTSVVIHDPDAQITVETQTQEEQPEEIHIPISHVASSHLDTSHHSIVIHQPAQPMEAQVQHCYIDNQAYQPQPPNVYTVNVQPFQPTQVYSVGSQPFQQPTADMVSSNMMHAVQHIEPTVGASDHFQHWTTLEDMGRHHVQDASYSTITTLSFSDQPQVAANPTDSQHQQAHHHTIQVADPQTVQSVLIENQALPPQLQPAQDIQEQPSPQKLRRGRKRRIDSATGERKRKKSAVQADKDTLMKKYFQQATVNLFFNERLKSPGSKFLKSVKTGIAAAKMSDAQIENKFHDFVKPLSWLFGKWRAENGQGKYPTMADFVYGEEVEFQPVGMKPMVEYKFYSWNPETDIPLHRETGFIRIKPESCHVAFISAHNLGVVEIQEGEVQDQELTVETKSIGRASFNKPPEVKMIKRTLRRTGSELEQVMYMQTDKTDLTEHLRITFKKLEN